MKIYTKTGDDGTTGLQGGKRVLKSNLRIIAYGAVDEINATIGIILSDKIDDDITMILTKIQNSLFVVGSDLSNPDLSNKKNRVTPEMVENLEKNIDVLEKELPPITKFILPGGHRIASLLHLASTITRRAETNVKSISIDFLICFLLLPELLTKGMELRTLFGNRRHTLILYFGEFRCAAVAQPGRALG